MMLKMGLAIGWRPHLSYTPNSVGVFRIFLLFFFEMKREQTTYDECLNPLSHSFTVLQTDFAVAEISYLFLTPAITRFDYLSSVDFTLICGTGFASAFGIVMRRTPLL